MTLTPELEGALIRSQRTPPPFIYSPSAVRVALCAIDLATRSLDESGVSRPTIQTNVRALIEAGATGHQDVTEHEAMEIATWLASRGDLLSVLA